MATLLLVDDQSMMLDGIEALLHNMKDIEVVGRCSDGVEAVVQATQLQPDLVLMDVNMPVLDGIEATRRLLKKTPRSRVLILSMYGHREFVLEVLEAGAKGYLLKNAGKEELRMALEMVMAGETYVSPELDRLLKQGDRYKDRNSEGCYNPLSKREMQVVKLIMEECTTKEIATQLFLSEETVDTHRRNIMHKLDLRNTAGLVKYAMERGWDK